MARESVKTTKEGGTAVEDAPDIGEQGNMFPDLDPKKPEEKKLATIAKKWIKIRDERADYLSDAKEKEDESHDEMVTLAKSLKIERFTIAGREITIEHKDKAKVKASKVEKEDSDEGDDD